MTVYHLLRARLMVSGYRMDTLRVTKGTERDSKPR